MVMRGSCGSNVSRYYDLEKDDAEQPWGDMGIHQVSVMTSDATQKIAYTSTG